MRERYAKLLMILQEKESYIKGHELAELLGVSTRTVRADIKDLNENYLIDARIITNQSLGYTLQGEVKQLKKTQHVEFEQRAFFIVKRLLDSTESITYQDLAQNIFFSSQTIRADIQRIQKMIEEQKRNIRIESIIFQGVSIKGKEIDKRLFLYSLVKPPALTKENMLESLSYYFREWLSTEEMKAIANFIENKLDETSIPLTPEVVLPIISYLLISLRRIQLNHVLLEDELPFQSDRHAEYHLAKDVLKNCGSVLQIQIPEIEIRYFSFYLMSQRLITTFDEESSSEIVSSNLKMIVTETLTELKGQYRYDFINDQQLLSGVMLHLAKGFYPLTYNFYIENNFINHIKMEYLQAYHIAVAFAHRVGDLMDIQIPENEIGYIALHFAAFIERNKKRYVKMAIVCGRSMVTSSLLKHEVERRFSEINIVGMYALSQLKEIPNDVQLIISSVSINEPLNAPIIQVNEFLKESDLELINQYAHHGMLAGLLKDQYFFRTDEVDKFELLKNMAKQMGHDDLIDSILDREELSSTEIGHHVALPHPLEHGDNPMMKIGIAINEKSINWGDGMVRLVFLIIPSESEQEIHAQVFAELYQVLKSKKRVDELIETKSLTEFLKVLSKNL